MHEEVRIGARRQGMVTYIVIGALVGWVIALVIEGKVVRPEDDR